MQATDVPLDMLPSFEASAARRYRTNVNDVRVNLVGIGRNGSSSTLLVDPIVRDRIGNTTDRGGGDSDGSLLDGTRIRFGLGLGCSLSLWAGFRIRLGLVSFFFVFCSSRFGQCGDSLRGDLSGGTWDIRGKGGNSRGDAARIGDTVVGRFVS